MTTATDEPRVRRDLRKENLKFFVAIRPVRVGYADIRWIVRCKKCGREFMHRSPDTCRLGCECRGIKPGLTRYTKSRKAKMVAGIRAQCRKKAEKFAFQGMQLTIREIAIRSGRSVDTVRHRILHRGWNIENAATIEPRTKRNFEAFGEMKTISQWADDPRCVVSRDTLDERLRVGRMSNEDAITVRLRVGRKRKTTA